MADVNYTTFLPQVLPYAVGAPEPTAIAAIRNATIEFLRNTHYLQEPLDPISVAAGFAEYEIDLPTNYEVVAVRALYFNHARLSPKSELEIRQSRTDGQKGTPTDYYLRSNNALVLWRTPDAKGRLTGEVAICPTIRSTGVDSLVADSFLEDIASGALSRLMLIPGEPFYEPQMAMFHRKQFASAIANAKARKNEALVNASIRVQLNRYA